MDVRRRDGNTHIDRMTKDRLPRIARDNRQLIFHWEYFQTYFDL